MILTRTPFRIPLGGGGTDLPAFYKKHGGFIFSATIDKYMYVAVNRPFVDKLIRLKYSVSETVGSLDEVKHDLAREALKLNGLVDNIEITSFADIPAGTGMGSSGSYLVGLLKALHALKREEVSMEKLAEEACKLEIEILEAPVGKQDQYLASFGGFVEMHIGKDGKVDVKKPKISNDTIEELEDDVKLFYTHKQHNTNDILHEQGKQVAVSESQAEKSLLRIKDIGMELKSEFEKGNVKNFGKFLDEHWKVKKQMSEKISDPDLDRVYELAKRSGADGGKIMGSGGGGLFLFYVPGDKKALRKAMLSEGLTEMPYNFDFEGSKVLINFYQPPYGQ